MLYRYGLTVQYEKQYGDGGGIAKDGTEIVDLTRVRTVLSAACNPLTSAQLSKLALACKDDYVTVKYTDPVSGDDKTAEMIPELSAASKALDKGGLVYWQGVVITMRER